MAASVQIPNPLYDVVFCYLLEDEQVARLFLSAILDKNIVELSPQSIDPTLYITPLQISVARKDFNIKVKSADNHIQTLRIVVKRAQYSHQLGLLNPNPSASQRNPQSEQTQESSPLPIYPIYILGEPYSDNGVPVVRVRRQAHDASTGEVLAERHPFIEALTHDAVVIQTSYLSGLRRRTELERLLSIFDQSAATDTKGHFLALDEGSVPDIYQPVVRRLQQAMANPELEADMDFEDEVIKEFQKKEAEIQAMRLVAERERAQKEEALQREEEERRQKEGTQRSFVRYLTEQGTAISDICRLTGLAEEEVTRLLES